ncbi:hypothetical protein, partial [Sulfitobacter sp. 1A15106]|uniref:hypothetical protein n=1 Tax=Sulfitobacter sp. 1A15106 TaxID=3368590 RepID=UPI003746F4FF
GKCVHMGQFSVTIYGATGSVLSDNQQSLVNKGGFDVQQNERLILDKQNYSAAHSQPSIDNQPQPNADRLVPTFQTETWRMCR